MDDSDASVSDYFEEEDDSFLRERETLSDESDYENDADSDYYYRKYLTWVDQQTDPKKKEFNQWLENERNESTRSEDEETEIEENNEINEEDIETEDEDSERSSWTATQKAFADTPQTSVWARFFSRRL